MARPAQLPNLLEWKSSPIVRLAWCRVHNGEFKQPRRSYAGRAGRSDAPPPPDLTFVGRVADSLVFQVTGGLSPTGTSGTDAPGFRYDLATDSAVVLPLVADPPAAASPYPGGLARVSVLRVRRARRAAFPEIAVQPALAIACALRTRCRFEAALKWYALVFDPLAAGRHLDGVPFGIVSPRYGRIDGNSVGRARAATPPMSPTPSRWIAPSCCTTSRRCWSGATRSCAAFARSVPAGSPDLRHRGDDPRAAAGQREGAASADASDGVERSRRSFAPLNPRLLDLYAMSRIGSP